MKIIARKELDVYSDLVQRVGGVWERMRQRDLTIFNLRKRVRLFREPVWDVVMFAGADTAAIGGGSCFYEVVDTFETEHEALEELAAL